MKRILCIILVLMTVLCLFASCGKDGESAKEDDVPASDENEQEEDDKKDDGKDDTSEDDKKEEDGKEDASEDDKKKEDGKDDTSEDDKKEEDGKHNTAEDDTDTDKPVEGDKPSDGGTGTDTDTVSLYDQYWSDQCGYRHVTYDWGRVDAILDKSGKTVYKFDGEEELLMYANGYMITKLGDVWCLKTVTGEMVTNSKKLNATGFGLTLDYNASHRNCLRDGYIVVYKVVETYNSVSYELGVINTDGEWVTKLSKNNPFLLALDSVSEETIQEDFWYVGDGCLIDREPGWSGVYCMYNMKTNQVYRSEEYGSCDMYFENGVSYEMRVRGRYLCEFRTDGSMYSHQMVSNDISVYGNYGYYVDKNTMYAMVETSKGDILACNRRGSVKIVKNFSDDNADVIAALHYRNGIWLVVIQNEAGSKYYGFINSKGEFLFDPIKTTASYIMLENGEGVSLKEYSGQEYGTKIVVNVSGKIMFESVHSDTKLSIRNKIVLEEAASNYEDYEEYTALK